jgi:2-polyprenyl-3-methyl-5-hydroxy-6-metoxy-1,4-benzoquinol methylase
MSTFVWMKVLESAPERYDQGIQMLSGRRIEEVYTRIAALTAAPARRILDIGCGTGGVSLACAARGASVTGIDMNTGMLEVARSKPVPASGQIAFVELGAAEIEDRFGPESFDAIVSCLAMSEISPDEGDYVLRMALSRLVPGGIIVIGDETLPEGAFARWAYRLWRLPVVVLTYLLTQTTTRPISNIEGRLRRAGFVGVTSERLWSGSFVIAQGTRGAP